MGGVEWSLAWICYDREHTNTIVLTLALESFGDGRFSFWLSPLFLWFCFSSTLELSLVYLVFGKIRDDRCASSTGIRAIFRFCRSFSFLDSCSDFLSPCCGSFNSPGNGPIVSGPRWAMAYYQFVSLVALNPHVTANGKRRRASEKSGARIFFPLSFEYYCPLFNNGISIYLSMSHMRPRMIRAFPSSFIPPFPSSGSIPIPMRIRFPLPCVLLMYNLVIVTSCRFPTSISPMCACCNPTMAVSTSTRCLFFIESVIQTIASITSVAARFCLSIQARDRMMIALGILALNIKIHGLVERAGYIPNRTLWTRVLVW